ncbi:hypothetical protein BDV97DRAFT_405796 [Delphinella strobiligena]|nr:hypothetical protein BDV97DRAFT_405796 [Delphinella strobiligena]
MTSKCSRSSPPFCGMGGASMSLRQPSCFVLNSVQWNIWEPGRYLPRNHNVYLAHDCRTEIEGHDESDARPLLVKAGTALGSTLTSGIFFWKKKNHRTFEELQGYPVSGQEG